MAITQVGSTTTATNGSATSLTCNKPTGVTSGHLLLALVTTNNDTVSISGWTSIMHADNGSSFGDAWFYKVAGGSEPSSYSITKTGSAAPMIASITALSGVDTSAPIDGHADNTTSGTSATASTPTFSDTVTAGRAFFSRSVRNLATNGAPSLSSATSGQAQLANLSATGTTPSYGQGLFWATADFTNGAHTPSTISITTSKTPTDNVNSGLVVKSAGVEVDLGSGSVAAASTTANDATVLIQTVQAATSSTTAYDASVDQKANATSAGATAAAYDGLRPAFASVGNVDTQAYSTSLHLDVNADVAEVTTGVVNAIAYYGASKVRMFQVPPENRTFMVRR